MAALAGLCVLAGSAAQAQALNITPRPLTEEPAAGRAAVIGSNAPIVAPAGDAKAQWIAAYLQSLILKSRGESLPITITRPRAPVAIYLERGGDEGPEGYQLDVGPRGARIRASSDAGLFYGAVSLWQLMTAEPGTGPATVGPAHVVDRPRFAYRGLLLDSARHFQSAVFIERMIDWMALHKLNVLQWHLTDDQGWRIQIRRYPRLTSVGAWRAPHDPKTGRPLRYGGFYTQGEIRRIVAYAAQRHVTIIPEIEMPGHSLSAILAYPKLGAAPADPKTQSDWGVFPDILAPTERTYGFMTDVLTEVMALFPGPWINIGGDEAVKDEWKSSPAVQVQVKALGLPNEDALQGWFTARIGKFLEAHGRRTIGWDDILVGGEALPANAATVSWHLEGVLKATRAGHDTVIALAPTYYFDNRQSDLASEPTGRGWLSRLAEVYAMDPTPATMAAPDAAHVIGVQANLWTEHMPDDVTVAKLAFPRAAALAETGWTAPERKDWNDFVERLPAELTRYHALGLDPDAGAVGVKLELQRGADGALVAVLSSQVGDIRYTLDGSAPSTASPRYAGPIPIASRTRLRAATFIGGHRASPELDETLDPAGPERRLSQQLALCTDKVSLNLAGQDPRQPGPYLVDIMNPCWTWPQADVGRFRELRVAVTRLPFNFQIGADAAKIALRPPQTPAGELEVRADGCAGEPLARLPLAPAAANAGVTTLAGRLPPLAGLHDLCFSFTQRTLDPMWVLAWVELGPAHAREATP